MSLDKSTEEKREEMHHKLENIMLDLSEFHRQHLDGATGCEVYTSFMAKAERDRLIDSVTDAVMKVGRAIDSLDANRIRLDRDKDGGSESY